MNYKSLEEEFSDYHKLVNLIDKYENLGMQIEITSVLRGITSAIDIATKAADVAKISENADLIMAIADLKLELANTKIELGKIASEVEKLEKENEKLKSPEWQLIFDIDKDAYYQKNDLQKKKPYCSYCWDNKLEKSGLTKKDNHQQCLEHGFPTHYCPSCKRQNEYL